MAEYSSNAKDDFMHYVSEKQPKLSVEILHSVKCIEDFAISTKALSHSIYEDLTEENITILKKKVLNHKFFIVRFKSVLLYAKLGLQLLNDYAIEKAGISSKEHTEKQITLSNTDSSSANNEQDNAVPQHSKSEIFQLSFLKNLVNFSCRNFKMATASVTICTKCVFNPLMKKNMVKNLTKMLKKWKIYLNALGR